MMSAGEAKVLTNSSAPMIKLGTRRIKELLCTKSELKSELLKLMDKGGLAVVFSGATLITV
jgi:hypothetical protein